MNGCRNGVPAVFHRNRSGWLVTMRFEDWIKLYKGEKLTSGCGGCRSREEAVRMKPRGTQEKTDFSRKSEQKRALKRNKTKHIKKNGKSRRIERCIELTKGMT